MHSILEAKEEKIEEGKIINEAVNQGLSSFMPDLMFENLVSNYKMAKQLYGEILLRMLAGYDASYLEKNINVPEFQRELKNKLKDNFEKLKDSGLVDKQGFITNKGFKLASIVMYMEELDDLLPQGMYGERVHKRTYIYGGVQDIKDYYKGGRYKDLAIRRSIKTAIRRGHKKLEIEDLKLFERQSKGQIEIIYAIDASGSMKGKKVEASKRAGVALAYNAVMNKDKVGLIVFGSDVKEAIRPCSDFSMLLERIVRVRASKETNFVETLKKAIELFSQEEVTKHLLLLTDAVPTIGTEEQILEQVSIARSSGITVSLVGIGLKDKAKKLAEQMTLLGGGRLYVIRDLENVDKLILEDYYSVY
ncbi:hypothetical protein DRJ17_01625 [Candidatus Woesearchaeota archaeon]|nr:MAG: hypothetical protein DRJ17_01625 [Candidatus Woesearchaeota archaeon]